MDGRAAIAEGRDVRAIPHTIPRTHGSYPGHKTNVNWDGSDGYTRISWVIARGPGAGLADPEIK